MHPMRYGVEIRCSSPNAHARLETSHYLESARCPLVGGDGQPKCRAESREPRRTEIVELCGHNANKSRRQAVQDKICSQDFWIAAKLSLPEPVAHHEYRQSPGFSILAGDRAAQERRDTQEVK